MIQDTHLKVTKGKMKPQIPEDNLVHGEASLWERRAYFSRSCRAKDHEIFPETLLVITIPDDSVHLPPCMAKDQGYSSRLWPDLGQ